MKPGKKARGAVAGEKRGQPGKPSKQPVCLLQRRLTVALGGFRFTYSPAGSQIQLSFCSWKNWGMVEEEARSRVTSVGERTNGRGGCDERMKVERERESLEGLEEEAKRAQRGKNLVRDLEVSFSSQINRRWSDSGDIYFG